MAQMKRIALDLIYGNPDQPRKAFNRDRLKELAASIAENGLKQPITVRADNEGRYMIVMGERRFRAYQLLAEQGKATDILCQVSNVNDVQLSIDAIIENDQRVDVTPLEQARSYQRMIDVHMMDLEALAQKLGKPQHRITERLALLNLTEENQFLVEHGQITMGQAWYLMQLSPRGQAQMVQAINKGLCPTTQALKATCDALQAAEQQVVMFELPNDAPTKEQRQSARGFEARLESVAEMLRLGIDDNTVTAVRKVNPGRASTIADLLAQMQKDVLRLENAFRTAAIHDALAAGEAA